MGISVAASAQNSGHTVHWASTERSPQTHARANKFALIDVHTVARLSEISSVIISVCPPHAAEQVANQVAAQSFKGLYIDANAISPQRAVRIGDKLTAAGATFADGGIIGGPAWKPGDTWLYLSGEGAQAAVECFKAGPLETRVIGGEVGRASALKMCYAAFTKGRTALLCAVLASAESLGVRTELEQQWAHDDPDFPEQADSRARRVTAKAWRFAGEMEEIAATFDFAGLPGGFHLAAAEVYRRMAHFKDEPERPELETVMRALIRKEELGKHISPQNA